MEVIEPPRIEQRPARPHVSIRLVTPFRGMLKVRDDLLGELYEWLDRRGIGAAGDRFACRYEAYLPTHAPNRGRRGGR